MKRTTTNKTNVDTSGLKFEEVKQMALNNEPVVAKVKLSDINFADDGTLSIEGGNVNSEPGLEKKLLKVLGLAPAFLKRFGNLVGKEQRVAMIEVIKQAMTLQNNKKAQITLLGNPLTKSIFNLIDGEQDFISNRFAMEQVEKIQAKYPQLKPHAMNIHTDGGFSLTLKTSDTITPMDSQGNILHNPNGDSEDYHPGITFVNSPDKGIYNQMFMWRLICTNGMEGLRLSDGNLTVNKLNQEQLQKFFDNVDQMALSNFASAGFGENLNKAMHTRASFTELNQAKNIMLKHSTLTEEGLGAFLPEFIQESRKLAARGYDYTKFTDAQLANSLTGATVWDVVNRVTDFGSHDYGFKAAYNKIQSRAGQLFDKKAYDADNLILTGQ